MRSNNKKSEDKIEHVSDTALMVAACRAMETAEPEGFIRDPFADRLAGERGMAIARGMPILEWMRFGVGIRAKFIDEILMDTLREGQIKIVLNLGSGLDTRPWRLELPSTLRWVEADFPAMMEYKREKLADARPNCRLEQVPADLSDARQRQKVFETVGAEEALMITEGLLMYLPRAGILELAARAPQASGLRHWLLDVVSEEMLRMSAGANQSEVDELRPKDHLVGQAILDAATENGWTITKKRTYAEGGAAASPARSRKLGELIVKYTGPSSVPKDDAVSGIYLLTRDGGR
ncbi:MAG TPA: SAM-dependent methyltransferase [Terriglobia bacterium]|nr:SAM-dependent methyltransferase [Terriglobia bacterium]